MSTSLKRVRGEAKAHGPQEQPEAPDPWTFTLARTPTTLALFTLWEGKGQGHAGGAGRVPWGRSSSRATESPRILESDSQGQQGEVDGDKTHCPLSADRVKIQALALASNKASLPPPRRARGGGHTRDGLGSSPDKAPSKLAGSMATVGSIRGHHCLRLDGERADR